MRWKPLADCARAMIGRAQIALSRKNTMHAIRLLCLTACLLLPAALAFPAAALDTPAAQKATAAVDRIGVPGPIRFDGRDFALAWSSNPGPSLYKQEYLPAGQVPESFTEMILIDVRPATANAAATVAAMAEGFKQRKASDPVTNYEVLRSGKGDEYILDFVIAAPHDKAGVVVEWNAYRYRDTPDGNGTIMVGISRRGYGDAAVRALLTGLKDSRPRDIQAIAALVVPVRMP